MSARFLSAALLGALLLTAPVVPAPAPVDKSGDGLTPLGPRAGAARARALAAHGGNAASRAAVALGLEWLALHQADDGHWGLHDFNKHARTAPLPAGRVVGDNSTPGTAYRNDMAGTAFALLPFLADGITHQRPERAAPKDYSKTVEAGLRYLLRGQNKAGADKGRFHADMYTNALATMALCEAYGLTADPMLKAPAQMALDFIVSAQHEEGGWRYAPRSPGDTSITGFQVLALKTGQMAGLNVPLATLRKTMKFLDSAERPGGGYSYVPGSGESSSMTAVGLLCRQCLGVSPRNPGLLAGLPKLRMSPPGKSNNIYYEYYATRVMFNIGGDHWSFWNLGPDGNGTNGIRNTLVGGQDQGAGPNAGNKGSWAGSQLVGGRLGATSLSLLTLQVYYRFPSVYAKGPAPKK